MFMMKVLLAELIAPIAAVRYAVNVFLLIHQNYSKLGYSLPDDLCGGRVLCPQVRRVLLRILLRSLDFCRPMVVLTIGNR